MEITDKAFAAMLATDTVRIEQTSQRSTPRRLKIGSFFTSCYQNPMTARQEPTTGRVSCTPEKPGIAHSTVNRPKQSVHFCLDSFQETVYDQLPELRGQACEIGGKAGNSDDQIRVQVRIFICCL